ncbi:MAG: hypothetical protein LUC48_05945 [Clostridiales bacterium]|nr:hypothetical protein [Clostridiales bacterium]
MKEQHETETPEEELEQTKWNTVDELNDVEKLMHTGAMPNETAYELDDIIREYADTDAVTPEATENRMEQIEKRLQDDSPQQMSEPDSPGEPVDPDETRRFIQQQVSEAIEPEAQPSFWQRLFHRKKQPTEPDETEDTDNVLSMPADPLHPIKQTLNAVQDKANDFADNMFRSEKQDEQSRLEERYTPGTDQEETPSAKPQKPRRAKQREAAPDLNVEDLAQRYRTGLDSLGRRTWAVLVIAALLVALALAQELGWPLPAVLAENPRVLAGCLTWGLALAAVLGLDVLWLGLSAPVRRCTGLHTMTAAAVLATLLDGVFYAVLGRDGPLPLAGLAALSLFGAMWGAYDRKKALYISCRTVSGTAEPYRVTLDEDKWDGTPAFDKEAGSTSGFGSQIQSMDGSTRLCRIIVPILLIVAVVLAVVATAVSGERGLLLWCLSTVLVAASPMSSLLVYGQPLLRVTRRLDRFGAVLAGWDGAESMSGQANILIKDEDLFPAGCVSITDVRYFGDVSEERVVACTASMLRSAGSGLAGLFEDLLKMQGGFCRTVKDLECSEAGGLSATIRDDNVLVGTDGFMTVNRIPLEGYRVRSAVYCAINRQIVGMFKLEYTPSHYVKPALRELIRSGVSPVLATRDFNITPGTLQRYDLPADRMEYPPIRRRRELSQPGQTHNEVLGALLLREGLGAFSDAVVGGRRLCSLVRINTILALLASVVGILVATYLTSQLAFASLTVVNLLTFLVLWLVPELLIAGFADKF